MRRMGILLTLVLAPAILALLLPAYRAEVFAFFVGVYGGYIAKRLEQ